MIVGIHHIGIAVDNLEASIKHYKRLGFRLFMSFSKDSIAAKSAFMQKGSSGVELWKFRNPGEKLAKIISKHFAFESTNLERDLQTFLDDGYNLAIPISAGTVVKRYAFVRDNKDNYVELVEPLESSKG